MTNPISNILKEAQVFTEQTIEQLTPFMEESELILALEALASKIVPLFEKSQSDINCSSNTLAERCVILFKSKIKYHEYAQKCVLVCPDLLPFFNQFIREYGKKCVSNCRDLIGHSSELYPQLSSSLERIIDQHLHSYGDPILSYYTQTAFISLHNKMPETVAAFETLVGKIEKIYKNESNNTKRSIYINLLKVFKNENQLIEYFCNGANESAILLLTFISSKLTEEHLQIPLICSLFSRYAKAQGRGDLPPWFESQIIEIKDSKHQREALSKFFDFINRSGNISFEQFSLFLRNPLVWVVPENLSFSMTIDLDRMMTAVAKNETNKKKAEEIFQTIRENYPLNELMLLSDNTRLCLLFLSLAPLLGISKDVCDALLKQISPLEEKNSPFEKERHLKIIADVLFPILGSSLPDPLDKDYLLGRILNESSPIPSLRMIRNIIQMTGFTPLYKCELEKSTFTDILRKTCLKGGDSFSAIMECDLEAGQEENERNPDTVKMTVEILNSGGFVKEAARDRNYELRKNQTIAEVQGCTALCERTLQYASEKPFLLSPTSLRNLENVNSLTMRLKRLGHAYNLAEFIKLPDGTLMNLEGFNETFVVPMLRAMFDEFTSLRKDLISQELSHFVKESLSRAVWHDNATDPKIDEIHKLIHDPSYLYPVVVSSGWIWHSTQVIFFKDHLYYCNRGDDCGLHPGISVFKIGNKEKITPEFLKRIASRLDVEKSQYTSLEKIKEELEVMYVDDITMKKQKVGNCVYVNLKAAIFMLMLLGTLEENPAATAKPIYKAFSQFDKEAVLKDFLIDVETNKTYLEGLDTVSDVFERWALSHLGKKQKISTDLLVRALTLICQRD